MYKVTIINEYKGYDSVNEEILVKSIIECDHPELKEIFEDLFRYTGKYEINYEYDGKKIYINNGYHKPLGQWPMRIDYQWLEYAISQMITWDYKNRIINKL